MKIRLQLKAPDAIWHSLEDAGIDPNTIPGDVEMVLDKFFMYGEYVTIEIDTETQTAEVLEA